MNNNFISWLHELGIVHAQRTALSAEELFFAQSKKQTTPK